MNIPRQCCRLCFFTTPTKKEKYLKIITKEVQDDFFELTNFKLQKLVNFSNLICIYCKTKLETTKEYIKDLIAFEKKILASLENGTALELPATKEKDKIVKRVNDAPKIRPLQINEMARKLPTRELPTRPLPTHPLPTIKKIENLMKAPSIQFVDPTKPIEEPKYEEEDKSFLKIAQIYEGFEVLELEPVDEETFEEDGDLEEVIDEALDEVKIEPLDIVKVEVHDEADIKSQLGIPSEPLIDIPKKLPSSQTQIIAIEVDSENDISDDEKQSNNDESDGAEYQQKIRKLTSKIRTRTKSMSRFSKLNEEMAAIPKGTQSIKCTRCSKMIKRTNYRQHIIKMHLTPRNFKCDLCGKTYSTLLTIEEHMNHHLNIKPIPCPYRCGQMFKNSSEKYIHVSIEHKGGVICELCALKFPDMYRLRLHVRSKHGGGRHKCPVEGCNKTYVNKGSLSEHNQSVHNIEMVDCPICNKKFKQNYLQYHVKMIHEGKFKCTFCDRRFGKESVLKTHEKSHMGIKDVQCLYCDATFSCTQYRNMHIDIVHKKMRYNCRVPGCDSSFVTKGTYRCHIFKVHKSLTDEEKDMYNKQITKMKPDSFSNHIV